jgi:nuclear pore complex protein Nup160
MFVQRNMFDEAQSAAAALEVDMSDYFVELTTRCVELSRLEGTSYGVSTVSASFLHTSPVTKNLRGPISTLGLRYLQTALQRHDNTKTEWRYTDVVADTFFVLNSDKNTGWQMPAWLVAGEMDRDPEGWISRALKWGWVEEAIDWSADLLRRVGDLHRNDHGQLLTSTVGYSTGTAPAKASKCRLHSREPDRPSYRRCRRSRRERQCCCAV